MTYFKRGFAAFFVSALFLIGSADWSMAACSGSPNGNCNAGGGEECDDDNAVADDGCTDCVVDDGYDCGVCDGTVSGDTCLLIVCGNGIVQTGEDCDNGNSLTTDCCQDDCDFEPGATVCRATTGVCDPAESCNGSTSNCPVDAKSTSLCRDTMGVCDPAESCNGSTNDCPVDAKSTAVCRADSGVCDPGAETCNGSTNDCPADSFTAGGTLCRSSVGDCDLQEVCTGSTSTCPADAKSSAVCRGTTGVCDPAESCNGSTNNCPDDVKSTTVCRGAVGVCDVAETCDGTASACPFDAKSTAVCRADSGVCDPGAETCNGSTNDCPADSFTAGGTLCRSSVGDCDLQEVCTGSTSTCPADAKSSAVCRASAGVCDVAESCNGTGNSCPVDVKSTAVCRPAVSPVCDVAESCNGTNADCPVDALKDCPDTDGVSCTEATCDLVEGCVIADNCVEICRSPGFWQTHSGDEKGENIGEAVLDEVGKLTVCGQEIYETTELGYLNSSLEGLCVRTQGVKNRQLYRQLVTTAFNCAISEGGSCDDVLDGFIDVSFTECSEVCEDGVTAGGPTVSECKDQLGCFNSGGRWIEDQCARGTCEEDTDEYCGGDYGDCPLVAGLAQDCVRFADSCAKADLCSDDLDAPAMICPKPGPASSPKRCNEARHNDCTIDSCAPTPTTTTTTTTTTSPPPPASCAGNCGGGAGAPGCYGGFSCSCYCDSQGCDNDNCADVETFCPEICGGGGD